MKIATVVTFVFLTLLLSMSVFATTTTTTISSRPILFVHGFNVFGVGEDCKKDWSKMEKSLASQGFNGKMTTVGYYGNDRHCDVLTTPHGTIMTHVSDLSHDLAWYIYNQYSSQNQEVDVVSHSMGGLMIRYALDRVAAQDSTYPPFLKVAHVAALAAPFAGYNILAESCHIIAINLQCDDMFPLSSFIQGFKQEAATPQGEGGTLWSNVGSKADFIDGSDGLVTAKSATSMNIASSAKLILPWYRFVFHTLYTRNKIVMANVAKNLSLTLAPMVQVESVPAPEEISSPVSTTLEPDRAPATIAKEDVAYETSGTSEQAPAQMVFTEGNDKTSGVQFSNVLPEGIFGKMGIKEGDVVHGCSSDNLNTPFEALASFETSNKPVTLNLCITRGDIEITKQVTVR